MVLAACGQLGQSYQDYHCSPEEQHMECDVDPQMSIKGVTHAKVKCSNATTQGWHDDNSISYSIDILFRLYPVVWGTRANVLWPQDK